MEHYGHRQYVAANRNARNMGVAPIPVLAILGSAVGVLDLVRTLIDGGIGDPGSLVVDALLVAVGGVLLGLHYRVGRGRP